MTFLLFTGTLAVYLVNCSNIYTHFLCFSSFSLYSCTRVCACERYNIVKVSTLGAKFVVTHAGNSPEQVHFCRICCVFVMLHFLCFKFNIFLHLNNIFFAFAFKFCLSWYKVLCHKQKKTFFCWIFLNILVITINFKRLKNDLSFQRTTKNAFLCMHHRETKLRDTRDMI